MITPTSSAIEIGNNTPRFLERALRDCTGKDAAVELATGINALAGSGTACSGAVG